MRVVQAVLLAGALFLAVLLCLYVGARLGRQRLRSYGEDSTAGLGAIEAAIYALMGLLIAFTFTGAAARFDHRRDLIVEEANAIGTAWQRLDLLEAGTRGEVRALFKQYLDARLETYASVGDRGAIAAAMTKSGELQNTIWTRLAVATLRDPTPRVASAVLPPVNEMFDLANTRMLATRQHPPIAIYLMLGALVLVSALVAGFGMAKATSQSILHVVGFAAVVSIAIYLIVDMELPRLGLLRVDDFDQALVQLRQSME